MHTSRRVIVFTINIHTSREFKIQNNVSLKNKHKMDGHGAFRFLSRVSLCLKLSRTSNPLRFYHHSQMHLLVYSSWPSHQLYVHDQAFYILSPITIFYTKFKLEQNNPIYQKT